MKGYHFVKKDGRSFNGSEGPSPIGKRLVVKHPEAITLCKWGYHGCKTLEKALRGHFIYGPFVEVCEFDDIRNSDSYKFVASTKTVLCRVDVTAALIEFGADCAERVLPIFEKVYPDDKRPRACIKIVRRFLKGNATKEDLNAACAAAYAACAAANAAAYAAAYAAASAASAAPSAASAASNAAYDADAHAAANAAASNAAERKWQAQRFTKLILKAIKENRK